jgi:hypothetical protein
MDHNNPSTAPTQQSLVPYRQCKARKHNSKGMLRDGQADLRDIPLRTRAWSYSPTSQAMGKAYDSDPGCVMISHASLFAKNDSNIRTSFTTCTIAKCLNSTLTHGVTLLVWELTQSHRCGSLGLSLAFEVSKKYVIDTIGC